MTALSCRTLGKCGGQANTKNQFQTHSVLLPMTVMIVMLAGVLISLTGLNYLSGYSHHKGNERLGNLFLLITFVGITLTLLGLKLGALLLVPQTAAFQGQI